MCSPPLCGQARRRENGRQPTKVLIKWALGLVGLGPRYTRSLIGMIQVYLDLNNGRPAFCWSKAH